jgi:TPR repeat protein
LNYNICIANGEGVGIEFAGAAHYFKFAADQGLA